MQPYEALLLRGRAYGEWMPLIFCYVWDLDEDVVSRLVGEVDWSSKD